MTPYFCSCFKRFSAILDDDGVQSLESLVSAETLVSRMSELQFNPLADRLCAVFSSRSDGKLSFEDFVDLVSVMSEFAPAQLKADWAFRVFGKRKYQIQCASNVFYSRLRT